ncbi:hypothetical protein DQ384_23275 [Sphaerisporangium album]|uniref:Uncharacterized protein n=1 Tax=Sphaerisporangium album TaxID=509200 RepID=A0A367FEB7_9ACTN|nr:hypothetical protein [Sphaerisporangium album]RCG28664.1 hypothetical protein DQ384_23275 [Sphaerisporangium album]
MNAYRWQTGADLLTAPITPATRAALFRVLAEQPEFTSKGQVTDALGRTGVALSTTAPGDESTRGDVEYRMIIDGKTAELLQIEVRDQRPQPLLTQSYERMGWVRRGWGTGRSAGLRQGDRGDPGRGLRGPRRGSRRQGSW